MMELWEVSGIPLDLVVKHLRLWKFGSTPLEITGIFFDKKPTDNHIIFDIGIVRGLIM